MSIISSPVAHCEKPESMHPWSKIIKDEYSNKIKYAHNSINNMIYPKPKEKVPREERNRFTVIGNRVTKDFIYCVHLVEGIYKYRGRYYEAPVIRGVTGIEWPMVLRELQLKYGGISFCLTSQTAVLYNDQLIGGAKELKDLIETRYSYHLALNYHRESVWRFINFIKSTKRPCAYFHVSLEDKPIGTFIFMLYSDICPVTCKNFLRLCNTTKGGYSGTPIHRIVKDGWIQCGGFGLKNTPMSCENFIVPHDRRGVLGMCNADRHMDCSTQFFVLLQPSEWMKGRFVAFGQLIDGEQTLQTIEKVPTYYESPTLALTLFKVGILNVDCRNIRINRSANQYIDAHIDDLVTVGEIFYQMLIEHVYLEIEFRQIQRLEDRKSTLMRATKRFIRKKEDIQSTISENSEKDDNENNNFDIQSFSYEPEEFYPQVTPPESIELKPKVPFYIPLTDVPYPGEVDSDFNLRRFLQGDYCLLSDLDKTAVKMGKGDKFNQEKLDHLTEALGHDLQVDDEDSSSKEEESDLDSNDGKEIEKCLEIYGEQVCFPGRVVRKLAKNYGYFNPLKNHSLKFSDEQVRRLNMAAADLKLAQNKEVQVMVTAKKESVVENEDKADEKEVTSSSSEVHVKIEPTTEVPRTTSYLRRPTGFVRPQDLALLNDDKDDDEDEEKEYKEEQLGAVTGAAVRTSVVDQAQHVKIAPAKEVPRTTSYLRRPTDFVRSKDLETLLENVKDDGDEEEEEKIEEKIKNTMVASEVAGKSNVVSKQDRGSQELKKQRQAGFDEQLARIKSYQKDFVDPNDEEKEEEEEEGSSSDDEPGKIKLPKEGRKTTRKIIRRPTGFVRKQNLDNIGITLEDEKTETDTTNLNKGDVMGEKPSPPNSTSITSSSTELYAKIEPSTVITTALRKSILERLYEDAMLVENAPTPTLKDYELIHERIPNNLFLKLVKKFKNETEESRIEKDKSYQMHSTLHVEDESFKDLVKSQFGPVSTKISDEYVRRLAQLEAPTQASLRSLEYARIRPSVTVAEYRRRNQEKLKKIRQEIQD